MRLLPLTLGKTWAQAASRIYTSDVCQRDYLAFIYLSLRKAEEMVLADVTTLGAVFEFDIFLMQQNVSENSQTNIIF